MVVKALNKDLSQKLEVQTQRLELLTAQNMASANILVKSADFNSLQDESPYPDEGDEVLRIHNLILSAHILNRSVLVVGGKTSICF